MADDLRAWFPFFAGDFLNSRRVRKMTAEQVGILILLLCEQWNGGPLPSDEDDLKDMGRASWPKVQTVLQAHFIQTDKGWVNERLVEIWVEQHSKRRNKQLAGKKGAEARWGKPVMMIGPAKAPVDTEEDGNRISPAISSGDADPMPPQCDTNGNESRGEENRREESKGDRTPKKPKPIKDVIQVKWSLLGSPKRGYKHITREYFEDVAYVFHHPKKGTPYPGDIIVSTPEEFEAYHAL
jgi:uncharacterized protein YdaU (DUF1376 family)